MRIASFYYLAYPDDCPIDPTLAATEMYVETAREGDSVEHLQATYAFQVYTFRYVEEEFIRQGKPLVGRSLMLVPTLADDWMLGFLEAIVDSLPRWGEPK